MLQKMMHGALIAASAVVSAIAFPYIGGFSWTLGTLRAHRVWSKRAELEDPQ